MQRRHIAAPVRLAASLHRRWLAAAPVNLGTQGVIAVEGGSDEANVLVDDLKQKFGRMGLVSHKKVGVLDFYRILKASHKKSDYRNALYAMNMFYNFGVKLKHREVATRFLAAAMRCKQESEAVEFVKLYSTWLEHPPDLPLIYSVMGHFLDAGKPLVVRELAKAVREDWRIPVGPPLYILAIEAMLQLQDDPVGEALTLYRDAKLVGVRLPAPVHTRLLIENLQLFEHALAEDANLDSIASDHMQAALETAEGLARDGHLRGGCNASTLISLSWMHWHLAALPDAERTQLLLHASDAASFLGGDWARILQAALENFGCSWGFSAQLPRGFFAALEASQEPSDVGLVAAARFRFGRFYPAAGV